MKFVHVTMSVKNLNESLDFYQNIIGLPISRRFFSGESEIVFLGSGETEIELIYNKAQSDISIGQNISLGFEVASLQDAISLVKQKGLPAGEVMQPNPQVKFFFTSDPNGARIQFVENIK